ncbi:MAG: hypothetical protein WCC81_20400, partial [Pseudolabrys sp.]
MDLAAKDMPSHGSTNQGRRDVIEKARQHENHHKQCHAPFPVIGQKSWHFIWYAALLKVSGQKRKAHQDQEQIGKDYPFMLNVLAEASDPDAEFKTREDKLVCGYSRKPRQRYCKCVMME